MRVSMNAEHFMRRAIALSKKGYPAPNPRVGCVLVRNERVIGEGFHAYAGGPHAEVVALANATESTVGSIAYVTLEPCNHRGRTEPCSLALVEAGVQKVVFAVSDPNRVASGGAEFLRSKGIQVEEMLRATEAADVNWAFLTAHKRQRAVCVVKVATTLDGRIARIRGESTAITSSRARREGRRLRAEMGAVLVGSGTYLVDNPKLTVRLPSIANEPHRIVLDGSARLRALPKGMLHWTGELHPTEVLDTLWQMGATGVLVEGGAETIYRFFEARVVDRVEIFLAPKVFGEGLTWLENHVEAEMEIIRVRKLGPDLQISLRVLQKK